MNINPAVGHYLFTYPPIHLHQTVPLGQLIYSLYCMLLCSISRGFLPFYFLYLFLFYGCACPGLTSVERFTLR